LQPIANDSSKVRQVVESDPVYLPSGGNICLEKLDDSQAFYSDIALAKAAVKEITRVSALGEPFFVGLSFDSVSTTLHVKEATYNKYLSTRRMGGPYAPVEFYPRNGDPEARNESWIECQKVRSSSFDPRIIATLNESDAYLPHPGEFVRTFQITLCLLLTSFFCSVSS
jgi:hypothetical protein